MSDDFPQRIEAIALEPCFESVLSKVISFRLDKDNPREMPGFEFFNARCIEGYSVRQVITKVLLKLNDTNLE